MPDRTVTKNMARYLPTAIWVAVLAWAVWGGISVSQSSTIQARPVPPLGLALFFAGGAIMTFVLRAQEARRAATFPNQPALGTFNARIRIPLLAAVFFTVCGGIATTGGLLRGSPGQNLSFSLMPLAAGLGMLVGLAIIHLRAPKRSA